MLTKDSSKNPISDAMRQAGATVISQFNSGCDLDLAEKVYAAMHAVARSNGGYVRKLKDQCLPRGPVPNTTKHKTIVQLFVDGKTMQEIGEKFCISRERVRQILKKNGVDSSSGGYAIQPKDRGAKRVSAIDKRSIEKYGISREDMDKYRAAGVVESFRRQRNSAKTRGIAWHLSFAQWIGIWESSGKLSERGRGKNGFCMTRNKDEGPYSIENVSIKSTIENGREAIENKGGNKARFTGVWRILPGHSKPWVAKYGKTYIGNFETEAEAAVARADFVGKIAAKKPRDKKIKKPRGTSGFVGVHRSRDKFIASVQKLYIGVFFTPEEANEARLKVIEQIKPKA